MQSDVLVWESIGTGLMSYKRLARNELKKIWRDMDSVDRRKAMSALLYIEQVAKNPKQFLSKAATEQDWVNAATQYAAANNLASIAAAKNIVQTPASIVWNNSVNALSQSLGALYYDFLEKIQNYEYATGKTRIGLADGIIKHSKRICVCAEIQEAKVIVKQLKQLKMFMGLIR